ncbi:hypothetical protein ACEZ3G_04775 [Maribacter algicola]|uniref:Uncharacterized protein n=1 Tax=Meishania litoralis TaxID=3434685 RepID=A0ACC7LHU8_9FLAO
MTSKKYFTTLTLCSLIVFCLSLNAQIDPGVYISDVDNVRHELKITDGYMTHSVYETSPAKFIKTTGGFYTVQNGSLDIKLEFNSNFENDGQKELSIPFAMEKGQLTLKGDSPLVFTQSKHVKQELDGQWLFATRGPDTGQERRGDENARKTLKYLQDGRFQWIAYNTETFKFHGTGGGSFSSQDGAYIEKIEYFSRDDSRVGAELKFDYELKDGDWHHRGKNSKGEPMYEIWALRK